MEAGSRFRKGWITTDQLFTLQQTLHDSWELDVPTHTCFIDLRKAHDTVNRLAVAAFRSTHIGFSAKIQRLIRDLHSRTHSSIRAYGDISEPFEVNTEYVKAVSLPQHVFLDHTLLNFCTMGLGDFCNENQRYCRSNAKVNRLHLTFYYVISR